MENLKWVANKTGKGIVYTAECPGGWQGDYFAVSREDGRGVRWQVWIRGVRVFHPDYKPMRTLKAAKMVAEAYVPEWGEWCEYMLGKAHGEALAENNRRMGVSS